jgi:glycosyltransferase involved in cell wall biosynthesis
MERAYFAGVNAVVCTSHATRAALSGLARDGLPCLVAQPGRDHLRGGLEPERVEQRAGRPGPLQILFLGNLIPRKGLDALLRTLARLPAQSWELSVAGSEELAPDYARRLRRLSQRLGLDRRVRWLGPLTHGQLEQLLPEMQLLAVPSRHEGFGIAYLDGMAYGLPCLASASGGATDLVRDGVNGYLIAPGDDQRLAARLGELIRDRPRLAQLGLAARRAWLSHPTWEETAAAIEAYLSNSRAEARAEEFAHRQLPSST